MYMRIYMRGPRSNVNEGILNIPLSLRTGA